MSSPSLRINPDDALVLFADLQEGILERTRTTPLPLLRKGVSALARLAAIFEIPVVITAIRGQDGGAAVIAPEITKTFPDTPVHHRTTADSFLNPEIRGAIETTGRRTFLISGVATEVAVQLAALTATTLGYRVFVVLDACGGAGERTEQAALLRLAAAGATTVSVLTLSGEMAGDFREPRAQQAVGILYEMASD